MTSRASTFTLRLSQIAVAPRHARVGSGSSCHPANRRRLRFVKSPRDDAKKPVASPGILNQVSKRPAKSYRELLQNIEYYRIQSFKLSAFEILRDDSLIQYQIFFYTTRVVATLKIEIGSYLLPKIFNQDLLSSRFFQYCPFLISLGVSGFSFLRDRTIFFLCQDVLSS